MLLIFDIGNTNVVCCKMQEGEVQNLLRLNSDKERTTDEYAMMLFNMPELMNFDIRAVDAVMICSVVPQLTYVFTRLVRKYLGIEPHVVTVSSPHGLRIGIENPQELGMDRLMGALAAHTKYGTNCITVDFGTATTFDVVSAEGEFLGGSIFLGIKLAAGILHSRTAQLPEVELSKPDAVLGKNTIHAIQSGLFYGYGEMVDGLIARLKEETFGSAPVTVLSTGGMGRIFAENSRFDMIYEPNLVPLGLYFMHEILVGKRK